MDYEELWDKFQKEAQYVTLDGKIKLRTIAIDFAKFCNGKE